MILGDCAKGKVGLAYVSRGSKSRNKVSVGEPAEGSVNVNGIQFRWLKIRVYLYCFS